jgi:uncharacterized membrane protein
LLFAGLWGAYIGAAAFQRSGMAFLSEAAILLGVGLFGASIMLIAQMYHIEGNPPDAVLTWAAGSLLAGVLLRSRTALALAIALVSLWSWWEVAEGRGAVHWAFLAGWAVVAVPVIWLRWHSGYHLLAIALAAWIVGLGYQLALPGPETFAMAHLLVIAVGLAAIAGGLALRNTDNFAAPLTVYGLGIAYAGLFALQIIEKPPGWIIALLAILSLALIVTVLTFAIRTGNSALTGMAYLLFSVELLALYFKTLGTLLDTALFFMVAGVIVIALALLAWRLSRLRKEARAAA